MGGGGCYNARCRTESLGRCIFQWLVFKESVPSKAYPLLQPYAHVGGFLNSIQEGESPSDTPESERLTKEDFEVPVVLQD